MCIAYGEMGLKPWEFEEYTWHQFSLTLSGYRDKEKQGWYQTREIVYSVIASGMNRPHRMPSKNEVMPLDTEGESGGMSEQEKQSALESIRLARGR